jgi:hypothetical protein
MKIADTLEYYGLAIGVLSMYCISKMNAAICVVGTLGTIHVLRMFNILQGVFNVSMV